MKHIIYRNDDVKIARIFDFYTFYWILANCLNKGYKKVYIYHCICRALHWFLGYMSWRRLLNATYIGARLAWDIMNLIEKIGWDNVYILEYPQEEWIQNKRFCNKILKKVPEFKFVLDKIHGQS